MLQRCAFPLIQPIFFNEKKEIMEKYLFYSEKVLNSLQYYFEKKNDEGCH